MDLSNLEKLKTKKKKRLGRGESSGKGKTAAKGAKGQKKRGKIAIGFEGGQLPLKKKLPQLRGLGNKIHKRAITITTSQLDKLPKGTIVNVTNLKAYGLIPGSSRKLKVRVVAKGTLTKSLVVNLKTTNQAKKFIEKAGGSANEASA